MAIKIVIDSAADINKEEADKLGIIMLPMQITFGSDQYYDGVDLLPKEFYEKLIESDELPKTSQITPYRYEEKLDELVSEGHEVIVITISSKLSNTYNSAVQASQKYNSKVQVIDSLNACIGERMLCLYAIELVEKGLSLQEISDELNSIKNKIVVMATIDTLEYLKKGGRISNVTAFAGELFSIKPVVAVIDGEVKLIGKARGSKKANNLLNLMIQEKGPVDFSKPYGAIYSGLSDASLQKYIVDSSSLWKPYIKEVPVYMIGSTIGTHVGPGAIGVSFFVK